MAAAGMRDLTVGKPGRLILRFAMPLLLGYLCQKLYNVVDTAIVGRCLGAVSLSAVGCTGPVNFLVLGFVTGVTVGFSIPVAQYFGAGEPSEMRRYVQNALPLCAGISLLLGALTGVFCPQILRLMNTPEEIFGEAAAYIRIIFFGIPVTMVYNMASGILRSLGDSRTPVFFVVLASVVNVGLDLLMIRGFGMGVEGAAAATLISQLLSGLGCVAVLARRFPILRATPEEKRLSAPRMKKLLGIGIPTGLQYSFTAIGSIVLQTFVNGLGTLAVGAVTAGIKVSLFCTSLFDALETAIATYAGQNAGAGKVERIRQGVRATLGAGLAHTVLISVLLWNFGNVFTGVFLDASESRMVDMAWQYLRVNGVLYLFLLNVQVFRSCIQGMGFTRIAMCSGLVEMTARTFVSAVLIPVYGFDAACFAHPAAWFAANLFLIPCYFRQLKKLEAAAKKKRSEENVMLNGGM